MKRFLFLCLLLVPLLSEAQRQRKDADVAFKGYKGNYILNFFQPASIAHPDGDVVGFRLDRKQVRETNWQTIQRFGTPATYDELAKNHEDAKKQVFEYRAETAYGIDEVWPVYAKKFNYDSLASYLTQQPLALAFKLLLLDTNVNNQASYQYRVVQVKRDNTDGKMYVTVPVSPQYKYVAARPKVKGRMLNGGAYRFVFKAKAAAGLPEALLVRRKDESARAFERILPYYTIEKLGDSVVYSLTDDQVNDGSLYQYIITPVNRYGGGASVVSDTVLAFSVDQKLLIPKAFSVMTDSLKKRNVLRWGFIKPELVGLVKIYRSEQYEDGYVYVGSSNKGIFADTTGIVGKKYYYYLTITDKLGRTSERSIKVYGLVQGSQKPDAPIYVELRTSARGNVIAWQDYNLETRGFRVYRTSQLDGDLVPISDFIFRDNKLQGRYNFTDTAIHKGGSISGYAVVAENLSNVQSDFSKLVYLNQKAAPAIVPVLLNLDQDKGAVRIFWHQNNLANSTALGFNVYRKIGDADFLRINKHMVSGLQSSFIDSLNVNDQALAYKLKALNADGTESDFSNELLLAGTTAVYAPGSLKSFYTENQSAILLEWQPTQSTVSKYEVYRYNRGIDPVKIGEVKGDTNRFRDGTFNKGQNNYYFVKAVAPNGNVSSPSSETYKTAREAEL